MEIVNSTFNWILFAIHLSLGIFFLVWFYFKTQPQPAALNPSLYSTLYGLDKTTDTATPESVKEWNLTVSNIEIAVVTFFFVTAFFHLLYATDVFYTGIYSRAVRNGNNWLRWIEYAISATIMIFVIATVSGMKDYSFVILTLCIFPVLMLQGQIVENTISTRPDNFTECCQKSSIIYSGLIVPTLTGWAILLGSFILIIKSFVDSVDRAKQAGYKVPGWLYFVIYPMLIWFASFGVVQSIQVYKFIFNKDMNYQNYEKTYLILSLLSKAFLGAFIGYGLTQRNMT